jgi:hypothetical protein
MKHGEPSVMTPGTLVMPLLLAKCLDSQDLVSSMLISAKEMTM